MLRINVEKFEKSIMIEWNSAEIRIPLHDIITIDTVDIPLKKLDHLVYIGTPFPSKKKILIKTKSLNYVLFVADPSAILEEINT
ncbi:hypothetical protein P9Y62_07540 [Bacillus thuringiensis]|uniref:Sublancin immunity protein SunI-like PH domain-containing protein n=1 Tax=Bacillus thuringiensis HD-771 TaxID=1218175 RepID=A0A9W3J7S3_BACTU|nr:MULTISPECIES: hypothetical protein [Bacillus cereus group]AFQ15662.1 hypothetical protein BTG_11000 [Bacillus thuringiensis HD-771]MDF9612848.1 hypothetical protein [Bacillus cereus]MEB4894607.1 hypothetical protein [Bacillus thuringiensis]MEC2472695.1 hypothetical protein [Bacillus thuringiensis]MEC2564689.1 hypothetical protein [Bacillus thuringiensis]